MAAERPIDDIERDLREIFGDDSPTPASESSNIVTLYTETELSQIEALLENNDNVNSDEEFNDFGDDTEHDEDDSDVESSSAEETEYSAATHDPDNTDEEWTLHRPLSAADIAYVGQEELRIPPNLTPYDVFNLFFTSEFINSIVASTNECASLLLAQSRFTKSRIKNWKMLQAEEFKLFLGILFHMGSIKVNRYSDYWRQHYLYNLFPKQYMGRNRFMIIFRCLRFGRENLTSLINYFNDKMVQLYSPGEELCIDESIILSRGRSGIRQYMPGKRHKYGIKMYILATPGGLTLQLHMYMGKRDAEVGGQGHTDKVVTKLLSNYFHTGRHVYMDNFYNSVQLAKFLLRKKIQVTGTLRSNRKSNPSIVCGTKLRKGGSIYRFNKDGICVCKWHDKRDVLTISTKLSPELKPVINKRGQTILKPEIVIEYNKYMSGVDRQDQMLAYYTCEHKSMRWYKKVGIHIFQMMMLNAYFLYNMKNNTKINLHDFRDSVITALLPPPNPSSVRRHDGSNNNNIHVPAHLPKNDVGHTKRKRCKQCWDSSKVRKNTLCYCPDCPSQPGLCLTCFKTFHKY